MYEDAEDDDLWDKDEDEVEEDGYTESRSRKNITSSERKKRAQEMRAYWEKRRHEIGFAQQRQVPNVKPQSRPALQPWKSHFEKLRQQSMEPNFLRIWPPGKEIVYILQFPERYGDFKSSIEIQAREAKKPADGVKCAPRTACPCAAAVCPAPNENPGRQRSPQQGRADDLLRTGSGAAASL